MNAPFVTRRTYEAMRTHLEAQVDKHMARNDRLFKLYAVYYMECANAHRGIGRLTRQIKRLKKQIEARGAD